MDCPRVRRLLSRNPAYPRAGGRPNRRVSDAVTRHLDGCPACRQFQAALAAFRSGLHELEEWRPGPLADLRSRALERWSTMPQAARGPIRGAASGRRWPGNFALAPVPRPALIAVAALAVLGSVFRLIGEWHGGRSVTRVSGIPRRPHLAPPSPRDERMGMVRRPETSGGELAAGTREEGGRPPVRFEQRSGATLGPKSERRPHSGDPPRADSRTIATHPVDDLVAMNCPPEIAAHPWLSLTQDQWAKIEVRVRTAVRVKDDFVTIPFPRLASNSERPIAQAVESYKREAAVVDPRLSREVTCAFKAAALSDLCAQLRTETGIELTAGASVADEKVTVFCEKLPLRDVMRQLSRPFGYTWLRTRQSSVVSRQSSGEPPATTHDPRLTSPDSYRYELVQDLRSQLLEEELRNRDRDAALLALEQEMSRYRRYLELSPDEARARAASAPPEEKKRLENLASWGWGPIHMYFGLSPRELTILRAGQKLTFRSGGELAEKLPGLEGGAGEEPLPAELRQGVLQSLRDQHIVMRDGIYESAPADAPGAIPLTAVPEAQPIVTLELHQSELGQYTLDGHSGFAIPNQNADGKVTVSLSGRGPYASGWSPAVLQPNNREANAKLVGDTTLRARVSFQPHPSCGDARTASAAREGSDPSGSAVVDRKVTTADVLEAIHQATGRPVVGDSYTRLYRPEAAAIRNQPLLDALNQVADTMHLRWSKAGAWLQFRSSGYYNDRLKEVPNRLLARWAASRRQHGALTLDDLLEIAQLPEAQLDATDMAEGARECWGLAEWNLSRGWFQRPQLRYLAQLTPAQRQQALSVSGLAFTRMSPAQQQQFIALRAQNIQSLEELAGATLRVGYTQPGGFQWAVPEEAMDLPGRGAIGLSPVHERTREAALQAARRIDPHVHPTQIVPTELALTVVYTLGSPRTGVHEHALQVVPAEVRTWGHSFPPSGGTGPAGAGS